MKTAWQITETDTPCATDAVYGEVRKITIHALSESGQEQWFEAEYYPRLDKTVSLLKKSDVRVYLYLKMSKWLAEQMIGEV